MTKIIPFVKNVVLKNTFQKYLFGFMALNMFPLVILLWYSGIPNAFGVYDFVPSQAGVFPTAWPSNASAVYLGKDMNLATPPTWFENDPGWTIIWGNWLCPMGASVTTTTKSKSTRTTSSGSKRTTTQSTTKITYYNCLSPTSDVFAAIDAENALKGYKSDLAGSVDRASLAPSYIFGGNVKSI